MAAATQGQALARQHLEEDLAARRQHLRSGRLRLRHSGALRHRLRRPKAGSEPQVDSDRRVRVASEAMLALSRPLEAGQGRRARDLEVRAVNSARRLPRTPPSAPPRREVSVAQPQEALEGLAV